MQPPTLTLAAQLLLDELAERGVTLYATDKGKLRYRPKSLLSSEDVEKLKEHKAEILRLLDSQEKLSSPTVPIVPPAEKADTYGESRGDDSPRGIVPPAETIVPPFAKTKRKKRTARGSAWWELASDPHIHRLREALYPSEDGRVTHQEAQAWASFDAMVLDRMASIEAALENRGVSSSR